MQKLANELVTIIVDEYGSLEFIRRISDSFWFQALGCALGYDWHSSGVTTVVTGILKRAIIPAEHGIAVCGGKGRVSRQTPFEIGNAGAEFGFSDDNIETLRYASRMSAKVDNAAIQAGYQLYHHAFFVTEDMNWAVVQQGMCAEDRTARRYHWLSTNVKSYVVEPQNAIVGDAKREVALDMTAKESERCRKVSVDLSRERPEKLMRLIAPHRSAHERSLAEWLPATAENSMGARPIDLLSMPRSINWKTLSRAYEFQPRNYEELLAFKGIGPSTVRGLALIAELVYGEKPSWKDPVKYSFAYGGKDGVPYPVDRKAMDESIEVLKQAIQDAKLGNKEKTASLQRLRRFVPSDCTNS